MFATNYLFFFLLEVEDDHNHRLTENRTMYNKIKMYKLICKLGDTILSFRSLDKGDKKSKRTKSTVIKKKPINGASSPPLNKKNKRKPEPSTAATTNRYV